jgi:prolyl oligopeptidase
MESFRFMSDLSRRGLMAATTAAAFLAPRLSFAFAGAKPPPPAKLTPVTDTAFGISLTDPYRWMESKEKDPDWVPYMTAQNAYARSVFDAIPGRAALASRISEVTGESAVARRIHVAGPWTFLQERPVGANSSRLVVRQGVGGAPRVLVDPNAAAADGMHISLDWWQPSDDGGHVVYGVSRAGSEDSVIHVMETATGKVLPERIPRAQYASPSWLPDGSGFTYNQLSREGVSPSDPEYFLRGRCLLHRLGTDPRTDVFVLGQGYQDDVKVTDSEFPFIGTQPGSPWAVAVLSPGVAPEVRMWVAPIAELAAGKPKWTLLCEAEDQVLYPALVGDDAYLLTFKDAPRYKVIKTSLKRPSVKTASVAVPQGSRVIQSMGAARDGLYISEMDGGVGRLRRLGVNGTISEIRLPIEGTVSLIFTDPTADGAFISTENYVTPVSLMAVSAGGAVKDTGLSPKPPIDLTPFRQSRMFATAKDGTKVPITLLHRADLKKDGSNIVLLDAYGSYGSVSDPYFSPRVLPFVEQGGVIATAHVRGGGEYGREWHLAGQKATKANTWRDVIACAEHLITEKWTSAGKLAVEGTSAGGIMATNVLVERPDLFAVVFNRVGSSNTYRMSFTPGGPANFSEFGDPSVEADFKALAAMDGYYRIKDGVKYPALLATAGMTDPRVPPWQGAKISERVRVASASGKPVLLRVEFTAGHGIGSTRKQADEEWADAFAFIFWQAGDKRYQPGG